MKLFRKLGFALIFGLIAAQAQAAPPLVNPVTFQSGSTFHLTPVDQNSVPIPVAQCSLAALPNNVTYVKDATGFVLSAATSGSGFLVQVSCTDGLNPVVKSPTFTISVTPPPYAVTAVGTVSP